MLLFFKIVSSYKKILQCQELKKKLHKLLLICIICFFINYWIYYIL